LAEEGLDDEEEDWFAKDTFSAFMNPVIFFLKARACLRLIVRFAASRKWAALVFNDDDGVSAISLSCFR